MAQALVIRIFGDATSYEKSLKKASSDTQKFGREMDRAVRGAASGTGIFKGFGRSLAFASGGFLAFRGVSEFITDSIKAAIEAGQAQRSLAAQMKASGESFKANREQIEKTALSYAKFGFEDDQVIASLTVLERGTGNISQAMKLQSLAADIARAKNIDLSAAANIVAKVFGRQETALRRAVPGLDKNVHGWNLLREAQKKVAGQAAANTTAAERFSATLRNTQQIIGNALLPTLNKYLDSLSKWLGNAENQKRIQEDATTVAKDLSKAFDIAAKAVHGLTDAFKKLNEETGSTQDTLKLLAGALLLLKSGKYVRGGGGAGGGGGGGGGWGFLGFNPVTAGVAVGELVVHLKAYKETRDKLGSGLGAAGGLLGNINEVPKTLNNLVVKQEQLWNKIAAKLGLPNKRLDEIIGSAEKLKKASAIVTDVTSGGGYGLPTRAGPAPSDVQRAKRTAQQLNAWFDAMVQRRLGRVQDIPTLAGQVKSLERIRQLIVERLAKTKDITRRLKLEGELADVNRQLADTQKQKWADFMDKLGLKVEMAGATKTLNDDIAAQQQVIAALNQQIKLYGATTDLLRQRFEAQQAIVQLQQQQAQQARDAAKAAKEARAQAAASAEDRKLAWAQFRLERAQTTKTLKDDVRALKVIIAIMKEQIRLTGLTVDRARALFEAQQQLRDVLHPKRAGGGGGGGGFSDPNMGFSGSTLNIAQIGPDGRVLLPGSPGYKRMPVPTPTVPSPGGRPIGFSSVGAAVVINGGVHLHGVQNVQEFEQQLEKRAQARPQTRRGPV